MKVNGKEIVFEKDKNILSLLDDFKLSKETVVIEVNFDNKSGKINLR